MKQLLLVAALLTTSWCQAQSSITLYGQDLKAKDILGAGKVFGPNATNKTVLIKTPVVTTELNQLLGTYYSTTNFADATDLLNILTPDREPILDSINFKFYRTAFLTTLDRNPALKVDQKYKDFKKAFLAAKNDTERRTIAFDDANTDYREALEQARYTVYLKPIEISAFTQIANTFKIGLGADVEASIKQIPGVNFGAGLKAAINSVINNQVKMTGAKYHEIKLQSAYVAIAKQILKPYSLNPSLIQGDSQFTNNLRRFFESSNSAITAGAAVIESTFTTESVKNLKTAIGAAVKANLASTIPAADATKIAAAAEAKFERESLKEMGVTTGQSFYTIRLVYSPDLELGAN